MNQLAITGYASLDYVMWLDGIVASDRTTLGRRNSQAWPRPGGCPTYIALAAHSAGMSATPVMWIGADRLGQKFCDELAGKGLSLEGISRLEGASSPSSIMAYDKDGGCACIFDPGITGYDELTINQKLTINTTRKH